MISLTIFIRFNFRFNPNLLGNNAIARISEHCGLMNRFGFNLIYQVKGVSLRKIWPNSRFINNINDVVLQNKTNNHENKKQQEYQRNHFFYRKYTVIEKKIVPLYAIKKTSLEEAENWYGQTAT